MENGSKNTYKRNTYRDLAFVSSLLSKSRKQMVMSRKRLSHGSLESAEILSKDCFAACQGLAAFLSFDLLLKSYKKFGS